MVKWESQSKTPPQSQEDGHIYCILLIRIAFCHVSENLPLRCWFYDTMDIYFLFSMSKLHVTSSQFCLYLLNMYHFTYTFSHAHTEAHTHKLTCTISTQEEWYQPGTGAWLRGAKERLCWRPCTYKKRKSGKTDIHESTEKIRAHRASSKATRLFLTK